MPGEGGDRYVTLTVISRWWRLGGSAPGGGGGVEVTLTVISRWWRLGGSAPGGGGGGRRATAKTERSF